MINPKNNYLLKKGVIFINVFRRLKLRVVILWFAEGAPKFPSPNPGLTPIAGKADADIDNLSLLPLIKQIFVGCIVI